jgi:hypothetical protein
VASRLTRARRGAIRVWRRLRFEQRVAAVGALLLVVSTLGPFSFVEAAEVLVALAVLALLRARGEGRRFRLPVRDGTAILAAGAWAGLLIALRLLDRPLGQNLLALACAAILVVSGIAERAKDAPREEQEPERDPADARTDWLADDEPTRVTPDDAVPTVRLDAERKSDVIDAETEPLPPPEFDPRGKAGGEAHEHESGGSPEELETRRDEERLG